MDSKTVLVANATGRLSLVAEILLARGHRVRAMTREPDSAAARRLRDAGAAVVYGDFDDPGSIEAAAAGADALFATGTAHRVGPDGELRHGRNLADAAAAAGVAHLVYSSGDGAAADSPLPLFRAKFQVEQHIRASPTPYTILAPVYFIENVFNPWNRPALQAGKFPTPIAIDEPLQQVAIADLCSFAVLAIEQSERFRNQRIALASDQLDGVQAAAAISRAIGRQLDPEQLPADELGPGLRALFRWLEDSGHQVEIGELRRRYPEVGWHSYETWAREQAARFRELCPHRSPVG